MKPLHAILTVLFIPLSLRADATMDRKAMVERHNITFTKPNPAEIPQVGNGEIAFGIDVTGLQSLYGNTFSQWGWHTSPLPKGTSIADFKMTEVPVHGHIATYPVSRNGREELYSWLRENPHRLNLGRCSFILDGKRVDAKKVTEINQKLDLWRGLITSNYKLDGIGVTVVTTCHPTLDALAVQVQSPLVKDNRLSVRIAFPYGHATDKTGANWKVPDRNTTHVSLDDGTAVIQRHLDEDSYEVILKGCDTLVACVPGSKTIIREFEP